MSRMTIIGDKRARELIKTGAKPEWHKRFEEGWRMTYVIQHEGKVYAIGVMWSEGGQHGPWHYRIGQKSFGPVGDMKEAMGSVVFAYHADRVTHDAEEG